MRGEWQPIESAPRDGTEILVVTADGGAQVVVAWDEDASEPDWPWLTLDGPSYHTSAFSHWMPLPDPPVA